MAMEVKREGETAERVRPIRQAEVALHHGLLARAFIFHCLHLHVVAAPFAFLSPAPTQAPAAASPRNVEGTGRTVH